MSEPSEPPPQPPRRRPSVDVPPSVLGVLSERLGGAPRVSLREEPSREGGAPVIDPASKERAALPEGRGSYTVLGEIEAYQAMGIRAFIFSGYPHLDECETFGTKVLPHLRTCSLPEVQGRVPATVPDTPLGAGRRR